MICSYCGEDLKPTKEHIIPNGFLKKMNRNEMITESEAAPKRVIKGDLVIKDVCVNCNNGPLSKLDSYALSLILQYNKDVKNMAKKIAFSYDLDKLQRWILKISFNSARASKAEYDCSLYRKNINYILGNGKRNSYIQTYILYMDTTSLRSPKYEIDEFRIGKFRINNTLTDTIAYRFIIINSFAFVTIVAEPNDKSISIVENELKKSHFIKLNTMGRVSLKQDLTFYKKSIMDNIEKKKDYLKLRTVNDKIPFIVITKEMVEAMDIQVFEVLKNNFCFDRDELSNNYQRIIIALEGYETEKREVYQIKEFQDYCRMVLEKFPELFWFANLSIHTTSLLEIMFWAYINDGYISDANNSTTIFKMNNEYRKKLYVRVCASINRITNEFAFDKSRNDEITQKIIKIMITNLDEKRT